MSNNNDLPIAGMTKTPYGWPLVAAAYIGCLKWAISNADVKSAFNIETGIDINSLINGSPLDQMIDDASGRTQEKLARFADFVTDRIWGTDDSSQVKFPV